MLIFFNNHKYEYKSCIYHNSKVFSIIPKFTWRSCDGLSASGAARLLLYVDRLCVEVRAAAIVHEVYTCAHITSPTTQSIVEGLAVAAVAVAITVVATT